MTDSDREFDALLKHITRSTGFACGYYKENYLRRHIQNRLDRRRIPGYAAYKKFLIGDPEEYAALLNEIGVNFSEFFRDRTVYEDIEKKVMPAVITAGEARGADALRFWSVPCATGEEPYSLAMAAAAARRRSRWAGSFVIQATDIDEEALEVARRGRYCSEAGNAIPLYPRGKFTQAERDGRHFHIVQAVSSMVSFARHDLVADAPLTDMDLVCHRNLLIYMKQPFHSIIVQKLYEALRPGGFLILGKTEFLPESHASLFDTISRASRIFQKK